MAKIEQFSVAPEFNDIIPILEEWTKGAPPGQKPVYGGRMISKSRHICQAIRMYARNTKEYFALMEVVEGEGREDEKIDQMAKERHRPLAPIEEEVTPAPIAAAQLNE